MSIDIKNSDYKKIHIVYLLLDCFTCGIGIGGLSEGET